jgi:putative DNA primase/helicase
VTEEIEERLSFVSLSQDGKRILLNDSPSYDISLPSSITSYDSNKRRRIVEELIMKACEKYNVFYVGEDKITRCAKEVVDVMFERANEEDNILLRQQESKEIEEEKKKKKDIILHKHESKADKVERLADTLENRYFFASIVAKSAQRNSRSNDPLYYYNNEKGFYQPAEGLVKARLEQIESNVITETVTNVIQKLARRHQRYLEEFDADINVLNLRNGLYSIEKDELQPHNPNYLSLKQLPILYDKNAKPKRFGKFLSEVLYPQQIRTVVELMAYTFHRANPFELYVVLLGNGANGKSVLMHVLTRLHGEENVSNTSLNALVNNRFAAADLLGKNVNIDMELSNATITDMAMLKKLTGQQPVRIERKNMDAYDTLLHAKLFFSTNEMPQIIDFSDGHYRREIVISFPNQFEEGKNANPNLKYELTKEGELFGLFNVLMSALRNRILKEKRVYVDVKTINERRLKHEFASNPVKAFFDDAVAPDSTEDDCVGKEEFHEAYVKFSKYHKLPAYNYQTFCKLLKQKIPSYRLREGRKGTGGERKLVWGV